MIKVHTGRTLAFAALASTALTVFAAPAFAQDNAPAVSEEAPTGEIIVSARRRAESLQTVPVAVTALQGAQLEGAAALTIGDLQGAAPNVLITSGGTGAAAANISIRGIAFADIEKSFDPAVGVNIDGVYIGTSTGQMLDFFDVDSIEVLRGPQGTLFGRNTIAGVINVKRSRPKHEFTGKIEAELGSYGRFSSRNVVNVPVIKDVLAVKGFYMHTEGDGYYRDITKNNASRGGYNNENFGVSVLFTPTSNFDALITFDKQVQDFDPTLGGLTRTGDGFAPYLPAGLVDQSVTDGVYNTVGVPGVYGRYSSPGVTGEMNLDLGGVKLTSVTAYRESADDILGDFATTGLYLAGRDQHYRQFSQELRAAGKVIDGLDYVAGVYYFDSRYNLVQKTSVFGGPATVQDTTGWSQSYAGFLDVNWEIFDKVRISGGGRYTHDTKKLKTDFSNAGAASFTSPQVEKDWSKFTPKVGIDYRPTNDLMLYASWSRGYRSGGFNGRGLTPFSATLPYDPETVDAYEVGVKSELFDRKVTLNLAAFQSDYKGIQQTTTVAVPGISVPQTVVINAAAAKIKGFEADMTLRFIENLTLRGSFGYTDSNFKGFIVNQPVATSATTSITRAFDFSGVDMIYAPEVTASINGEYSIPFEGKFNGEVKLNAGYRYLAPYDQQVAADPALYPVALASAATDVIRVPRNDPRLRSDAQNLVDVSVSVIFKLDSGTKARVTGFARNLLDDRGTQTAFDAGSFPVGWGFATAREPRVYGVQLGLEF